MSISDGRAGMGRERPGTTPGRGRGRKRRRPARGPPHERQKRGKVGGALLQSRDDGGAEPCLVGGMSFRTRTLAVMLKFSLAVELGMLRHRKLVFQTHPVGESPHRPRQSNKASEFVGAVQRRGIIINVVMDVPAVGGPHGTVHSERLNR